MGGTRTNRRRLRSCRLCRKLAEMGQGHGNPISGRFTLPPGAHLSDRRKATVANRCQACLVSGNCPHRPASNPRGLQSGPLDRLLVRGGVAHEGIDTGLCPPFDFPLFFELRRVLTGQDPMTDFEDVFAAGSALPTSSAAGHIHWQPRYGVLSEPVRRQNRGTELFGLPRSIP